MEYNRDVQTILYRNEDFNLKKTFECGQCFRFHQIDEDEYLLIAMGKILRLKQAPSGVLFYCEQQEFDEIWRSYFDLDLNYGVIKDRLIKLDEHILAAITEKSGLRLVQQEPFEMLISFIISQSKQINHIKKLIEDLSCAYGNRLGQYNGRDFYSFPTAKQLENITEPMLRDLKLGYRAPYIMDAVEKILSGKLNLEMLFTLPYDQAKSALLTIHGVGEKVADCVLLFAFRKYEAFPVDVWVKRIMEYFYFGKETKIQEVRAYASTYFGEYAGIAQQYLFYYARDNKLGK